MKTPTEVSLERVAKVGEQMGKVMGDLAKALERQNVILTKAFAEMKLPPQYTDIDQTEQNKKDSE